MDLTALGSTLQYNVNLAAEIAKNTPNDKAFAHAQSINHLFSRSRARDIKVVGITKIKNEGNLPALAIQQWLEFCDHIIISDASDEDVASQLTPFGSAVTRIKQIKPFKENLVYDQLYLAARDKKATHILHFDVDEILAPEVSNSDFFDQISRLEIGESLAVNWAQLFSNGRKFMNLTTSTLFKTPLFIDCSPSIRTLCSAMTARRNTRICHCTAQQFQRDFLKNDFFLVFNCCT